MGDPYSRIDLTNVKYKSLDDLRSLDSDEWRLINSKMFNDFFTTHSIWLRRFKLLIKVILKSVIEEIIDLS